MERDCGVFVLLFMVVKDCLGYFYLGGGVVITGESDTDAGAARRESL